MAGKLLICPTPIGNLGDITARTRDALVCADAIYSEDTRVTSKLLAALGLNGSGNCEREGARDICDSQAPKPQRLDENTMAERAAAVVQRVLDGETVVYCSDAGMPGVSDPGLRLVRAAREAGAPVEVLPGPSAAVTAFVAAAPQCESFFFGGFFPRKDAARRELLDSLAAFSASPGAPPTALIFYESPNRLVSALAAIAEVFPHREVTVCRELTKLHEEVACALAPQVAADFAARAKRAPIKGEIVIVIGPATKAEKDGNMELAEERAAKKLRALLEAGESTKTAALIIAEEFVMPKNLTYELAVAMKHELDKQS